MSIKILQKISVCVCKKVLYCHFGGGVAPDRMTVQKESLSTDGNFYRFFILTRAHRCKRRLLNHPYDEPINLFT